MCRTNPKPVQIFSTFRMAAAASISALAAFSILLLPTQNVSAQCTCNDSGLTTSISVHPAIAHVGDTITIVQIGAGILPGNCIVTNGQAFIMYPNGVTNMVAGPPTGNGLNGVQTYEDGFNLLGDGCAGPDSVQCLPTVSGTAGCMPITSTYTVDAADIGRQLGPWTTPRGAGIINFIGLANKVQFGTACDAFRVHDGLLEGGQGPAQVTIVHPGITITKQCDYGSDCGGTNFVYGSPIKVKGTLCNTGDIVIVNITVTNTPTGGTPHAVSGFDQFTTTNGVATAHVFTNDFRLLPKECIDYHDSYQPSGNLCGPFPDTVTARGQDFSPATGFQPQTVTASSSATCTVCTSPCIDVSKTCGPPTVCAGDTITFSGTVTNCGNVPLTNVVVRDTVHGTTTTVTNFNLIDVGGSAAYSGSYATLLSDANTTVTDVVTATGVDICSGASVRAQAPCSVVVITCAPRIEIFKQVVCFSCNGDCSTNFNTDLTTQKSAIGAKAVEPDGSEQCPAFCYRITVINTSDPNIILTNLTVTDDKLGSLASCFPTSLGAPGSTNDSASCIVPGVTLCDNTTNIVTASANGINVTAGTSVGPAGPVHDTNVVVIIPFEVSCTKQASTNGVDWVSSLSVASGTSTPVFYRVIVNNLSDLPLIATITDATFGCPPITDISLPPLGSVTNALCSGNPVSVTCPPGTNNTVDISAVVDTGATNLCACTTNHVPATANSSCSAVVTCQVPNACRVTGGGRQDVPEVFPILMPDGGTVRYVTHGGQVGAPVGDRVCVVLTNFFLGNPCIHGRWTHVRHEQGGLEGNFHARFFDTLECACLDTNTTATSVTVSCLLTQTYTNLVYGPGTKTDGVCGNRNIGPEPRPAPANKIVFTGVGDYALTQGRRAPRSVLFRVDIEDRGEPGNFHALDASRKSGRVPDRYRIRIWILTPSELAQLRGGSGDRWLINFRNCISACNGINVQDGASVPNGTAAFGVRAPDIDDGGALEHGNHQIHPAIMQCDPFNPTGPGLAKP